MARVVSGLAEVPLVLGFPVFLAGVAVVPDCHGGVHAVQRWTGEPRDAATRQGSVQESLVTLVSHQADRRDPTPVTVSATSRPLLFKDLVDAELDSLPTNQISEGNGLFKGLSFWLRDRHKELVGVETEDPVNAWARGYDFLKGPPGRLTEPTLVLHETRHSVRTNDHLAEPGCQSGRLIGGLIVVEEDLVEKTRMVSQDRGEIPMSLVVGTDQSEDPFSHYRCLYSWGMPWASHAERKYAKLFGRTVRSISPTGLA